MIVKMMPDWTILWDSVVVLLGAWMGAWMEAWVGGWMGARVVMGAIMEGLVGLFVQETTV